MEIGIEMSLYPLNADFIPPIQGFIDRLNARARFRVITNSMSTQVFGEFDDVFGVLVPELKKTFETNDKAVFVMKVLGPFAPADR
jgi:YKOF-related protein